MPADGRLDLTWRLKGSVAIITTWTVGQEQCSIGHLYVNQSFTKGHQPGRGHKRFFCFRGGGAVELVHLSTQGYSGDQNVLHSVVFVGVCHRAIG